MGSAADVVVPVANWVSLGLEVVFRKLPCLAEGALSAEVDN